MASVSCVVAESEGVGLEQRKDSQFKPIIAYLEDGTLPGDDAEVE